MFKKLWNWIRANILRDAKARIAAEIRKNIDRIDEAVNAEIIKYAAATGGLPFVMFVTTAIDALGLSHAASDLLKSLLAGFSRAEIAGADPERRQKYATHQAARFMEMAREEADK